MTQRPGLLGTRRRKVPKCPPCDWNNQGENLNTSVLQKLRRVKAQGGDSFTAAGALTGLRMLPGDNQGLVQPAW